MSGGEFDFSQYKIEEIAESIQSRLDDQEFSKETIREFETAVRKLREAYVYAQRIDYLISSDDSEESFHKRLKDDLESLKIFETI